MSPFLDDPHLPKVAASLLALAAFAGVRRFAPAGPAPNALGSPRIWSGGLLVAALCLIWSQEIGAVLWSLAAVAAAFVIATKEMIACLTGWAFRRVVRTFGPGSRIEVDGVFGEVVSQGPLAVALDEMDRGAAGLRRTGRRVFIPNSRLFSADLRVDAPDGALVPLAFHLTFDGLVSTQAAVATVEETLRRGVEGFRDMLVAARMPMPAVTVETTELGRIRLDVVCTVPSDEAAAFERDVKMEFLEWLWGKAQERKGQETRDKRRRAVNDDYGKAA